MNRFVSHVFGAETSGDNLIVNPGFEGKLLPDGMPEGGWYRSYGDANSKWVVQTGGAHSGEKCVRLEAPTLPEHNPSVSLEQAVPVTPGKSYVLHAWVKGQPSGSEGLLAIVWLAKDKGWLTHTGSSFRYTSDWQRRLVSGTAPEGAALGVVRVDIRQPGTAWVDDVFFAERQVVKITTNVRNGTITAGQRFRLEARALDPIESPVEGAEITLELSSVGDARFLTQDKSGDARRSHLLTNKQGVASTWLRSSAKPGLTDTIALRSGKASLQIQVRTATQGEPTSYDVTPDRAAVTAGQEAPIRIQLLGREGEPIPLAGRKVLVEVVGQGSVSPSTITTDRKGKAVVRLRMPTNLFARGFVTVHDSDGVAGQSPPVTVVPPMRSNVIRIAADGCFRHPNGHTFIPLGGIYANWVHKVDNGVCGDLVSQSFSDATDEQLRQWFAYLHDNGVTALRAMLRDHTKQGCEPMDIIGNVNENLLRRWEHLMELARPFGIRFLVTLHESWYATYAAYFNQECLEKCVLPYYPSEELRALPAYRRRFLVEKRMLEQLTEPMTDPDVLACQRDYLTDLIPRLRSNPDIFAYEIENEQPNGFFDWTNEQIHLIRELDPFTPICVSHLGGGLLSADPLTWSRKTDLDFYTYHIYPAGEATSKEMDYGATVAVTARYSRLGKPAFSGESFGDEWYKAAPDARKLGARDCIWSQIMGGAVGCFFWNTIDEPIKEFRMTRQILGGVDFNRFHRAKPRVGIDVSHALAEDRFFQTPSGKAMYAAMGRMAKACFARGVDFDFTFDNSSYPVRLKVEEVDAISRLKPEVQVPEGYEAQYLLSDDGRAFLCYLRNVAATVPIQSDPGMGWTRTRKKTRLTVAIHLPLKASKLKVYDLDEGRSWETSFVPGQVLDLDTTEHDMIIVGGGTTA